MVFFLNCHTKKDFLAFEMKKEHIPSTQRSSLCYKYKVNAALVLEAVRLLITVFLEGFLKKKKMKKLLPFICQNGFAPCLRSVTAARANAKANRSCKHRK